MGASSSTAGLHGPVEVQRVVMITGCSRGGLGHSLALAFARAGFLVVATARSLASMEGLHAAHPNIQTLLQLEVTSAESRDAAVAAALDRHGRIDILVNNAGVLCAAPVAEIPPLFLQSTFTTNVFAPIYLIQAVVPQMMSRRAGTIVNIGSVAAYVGAPFAGGYSASKAAFHALSDSLRMELKPFGIDVVVVAPGIIRSNIETNAMQLYNNLPKWKFYQPWEHFIKRVMGSSKRNGCTSSEEFAETVVKVVCRRNPPPCLTTGHLSFTITMFYYIPLRIRDIILTRRLGLDHMPSSNKVD